MVNLVQFLLNLYGHLLEVKMPYPPIKPESHFQDPDQIPPRKEQQMRFFAFGDKPHQKTKEHQGHGDKGYIVINHTDSIKPWQIMKECRAKKACYTHEDTEYHLICFGDPGCEPTPYTKKALQEALKAK